MSCLYRLSFHTASSISCCFHSIVCLFLCPYTSLSSKLFPVWLWCLCLCCFVSFPSFVIAYFHLFSLSLLVPLYLRFCPYPSSVCVCLCTSLGLLSWFSCHFMFPSLFIRGPTGFFFSLWFFCVALFLLFFAGCSLFYPGLPSCL